MSISRRRFIRNGALAAAAGFTAPLWLCRTSNAEAPQSSDKFQPTWDSLAQYECPEWFRDAKFGIWAHWSAQCVPEQGDWYAKSMYQEGSADYKFHCATYGHPSQVGFKEIDHMWKADKWDPEKMIELYKGAGAKYFVALANHHDNFDCFDSAYQPWNSVNIGPKKDIVGTWAKAARKAGLRFGVTVHASHTWNWFEVAQGADKTGPYAGVPYDGKLTKADGAGKWWEGLDPQDLYAQNHPVSGGGWEFEGSNPPPDAAYCEKFFNRTVDLIDKYNPDLLYFDDSGLPLHPVSDVGLRIAAHYYNSNMARHRGHLEAVLNTKGLDEQQRKCMVLDFERGKSDRVEPSPWQTDTCIGNWHYQRSLYENHQYKTPDQVVKMLMDIVSKNGNLLLNIPVRGSGEIDPDEIAFIQGLTAWMAVNEEAVFSTRPWKISGEGPIRLRSGGFSEGGEEALTSRDFRFTTKGNVLYATAMGWPDDDTKLVVGTLGTADTGLVGTVKTVELLGHGPVAFRQTDDGLEADLPANKPCDHAYVLKITGLDLANSNPQPPPPKPIVASADGTITLPAELASLNGTLRVQSGSSTNIGYWNNAGDTAAWSVHFDSAGSYSVTVSTASLAASSLTLDAGNGITAALAIPLTGDWDKFQDTSSGVLNIPAEGDYAVTARATDPTSWQPINLARIVLKKS